MIMECRNLLYGHIFSKQEGYGNVSLVLCID